MDASFDALFEDFLDSCQDVYEPHSLTPDQWDTFAHILTLSLREYYAYDSLLTASARDLTDVWTIHCTIKDSVFETQIVPRLNAELFHATINFWTTALTELGIHTTLKAHMHQVTEDNTVVKRLCICWKMRDDEVRVFFDASLSLRRPLPFELVDDISKRYKFCAARQAVTCHLRGRVNHVLLHESNHVITENGFLTKLDSAQLDELRSLKHLCNFTQEFNLESYFGCNPIKVEDGYVKISQQAFEHMCRMIKLNSYSFV